MFSMILVIVAITLVVVLLLATLYFGGSTFQKDSKKLVAHTLISQSGQIAAARQLARTEDFTLPEGKVVQFPTSLLTVMPTPPRSAYADGAPSPTATDWEYYLPASTDYFGINTKLNRDTCMEVNRSQGFIGIPAAWDGVSRVQCFGPTATGYTYIYELPGHTSEDHTAAVDKSVSDALPAAPTARPGYPRLCPDGTTVETGLCTDGSTTGAVNAPSPAAKGFWVITASADDSDAYLNNQGYSDTCPDGAVDPTGSAASPAPSLPGEAFNIDGAVQLGWQLSTDSASSFPGPLSRTWCIPANKEDVPTDGTLSPGESYGGVTDVVQKATPQSSGIVPNAYSSSTSRTVVIQANGVTWSLLATQFSATTENADNGDYVAMVGRKVAIGKTAGATKSYFVNSPSILSNDVAYQNLSGVITFDPPQPPCVPPVSNAPLGTGGAVVDIWSADWTSVLLLRDGSVWMSGAGWDGQFGNCRFDGATSWTRVATSVTSLDQGAGPGIHLVKTDGSVWTYDPDIPTTKYVRVYDSGAKQAASTGYQELAVLRTDGTLWYRGLNWYGEAGNGSSDEVTDFVQVDTNVSKFAASGANLYYIKNDGSLWATGGSMSNHLGAAYPPAPSGWPSTPDILPLKLADNVVSVAGTVYTTVYVTTDGRVFAAGEDLFGCGMFGKGTSQLQLPTFTQIASELGPLAKVKMTNDTIWLQSASGMLYAAGCNSDGGFGDGTTNGRSTFTLVGGNITAFFGGGHTSLLEDSSGTLWVAGYNSDGQFGNGTTTSSLVFQPVQY